MIGLIKLIARKCKILSLAKYICHGKYRSEIPIIMPKRYCTGNIFAYFHNQQYETTFISTPNVSVGRLASTVFFRPPLSSGFFSSLLPLSHAPKKNSHARNEKKPIHDPLKLLSISHSRSQRRSSQSPRTPTGNAAADVRSSCRRRRR